ncbi:Ala-tRNA(Pro) deacylase [Thermosporothrix hazakensis]|uniref:Ala-tRNA(Pro) deacylase n=2 Tax=Thermosporothrix hazakensis TaxID=644383 RepID=A0A326U8Y1_THEHA|nr:Ala-tRNA(Pro) deacylase [Thermosporothrix hazakensis]GCE50980.1 deacylase [Thermosporothrix hazakensis]
MCEVLTMQCQKVLEEYLNSERVDYTIQHHPVAYTAQQLAEYERVSGKMVAKSVIVYADNKICMLVLPASARVDFDKVRHELQATDVRLATEDDLRTLFPNCEVGSMPPFGNLYHLPVFVDSSLKRQENIVFPIGTHTETMKLRFADFERLVRPTICSFAQVPVRVR